MHVMSHARCERLSTILCGFWAMLFKAQMAYFACNLEVDIMQALEMPTARSRSLRQWQPRQPLDPVAGLVTRPAMLRMAAVFALGFAVLSLILRVGGPRSQTARYLAK